MSPLPTKTTHAPASQDELAEVVARAYASGTPLYPVGGGTSLNYGLPAKAPGEGLSLAKLYRIIDYPARDLTVTVEAGVTMRQLADELAKEGQELPIDVPQADQATVGGVVATNWNGPRRYGLGTVRDYVIGITAVDGRGTVFSGGGRVVKNVAGYDFCKLLTGSLGTLGVITQVTFKLRPKAQRQRWLGCVARDGEQAESVLTALGRSSVTPHAIELLVGPTWAGEECLSPLFAPRGKSPYAILALIAGTEPETAWMAERLLGEWRAQDLVAAQEIGSAGLWSAVVGFSVGDSPLTMQASVVPSGVIPFVEAVKKLDPEASIQTHAGNGVVIARFSQLPAEGASKAIISTLQPLAARHQGHVNVLSAGPGVELTRQVVWGSVAAAGEVMASVKRQFDAKSILNPGRFVFA